MSHFVVVDPGNLSLIQDLGRSAFAAQGVARAGAADLGSHALAQRLCGNSPHAAGVEVLLGGLRLRAEDSCTLAVTGAPVDVRINGEPHGQNHALNVVAGDELSLSRATSGMRVYVAFRGGIEASAVFGSRSRDTLGGIGPEPLAVGDTLTIDNLAVEPAWFDVVAVRPPTDEIVITLAPGPHDDVLDADGWNTLLHTVWHLDARSDRIGFRLAGSALPAPSSDLASFPVIAGCVQLPGNGLPVVLGPDCGVTGGYPVLGIVDQAALNALAQARPGVHIRMRRSH